MFSDPFYSPMIIDLKKYMYQPLNIYWLVSDISSIRSKQHVYSVRVHCTCMYCKLKYRFESRAKKQRNARLARSKKLFVGIGFILVSVCPPTTSRKTMREKIGGQNMAALAYRRQRIEPFPRTANKLLSQFFQGSPVQRTNSCRTKVLRVFLFAIHSHLYSFALLFLFLQTHGTSYSFYSLVIVHCKVERRKT